MTLTRRQGRQDLYNLGYSLGYARNAESIALDGIVDPAVFLDADESEGDYVGRYIYRPDVIDPDRVKRASIVSGSELTHAMEDYTDDLSELYYEIMAGGLHPDEVNNAFSDAGQICYFNFYHPVGWQLDNDFSQVLTTGPDWDWTSGSVNTASVAKSTNGGVWTQAGQTGPRNLIHTGTAAGNGYVPTSRLNVEPKDELIHGAFGRVNGAYTGSYVLYDVTNAAALETITFTSRAFQRIMKQTTIPAGCYQVEQRIGNVTASGVTEWDCLFGHLLGRESGEIVLPSYLTNSYQLLGFGPAVYGRTTGSTNLWNATSRRIEAWYPHQDYEALMQEQNSSTNTLQINRDTGLTATDFWIYTKRPYSSVETIDDENDVTVAPRNLYLWAYRFLVFQILHGKEADANDNSTWKALMNDAWRHVEAQWLASPPIQPKREHSVRTIGMRRWG